MRSEVGVRPAAKFAFGKNWKKFVRRGVGEPQVRQATASLLRYLPPKIYAGARFLDLGCGSGIFSLGAAMLGCGEVLSVDIDADALDALESLREKFAHMLPPGLTGRWFVRQGDVLSETFVEATRPADIVYAWGMVHHTGRLWHAMKNVGKLTKPGGYLILGVYNHAPSSEFWAGVKARYNAYPLLRPLLGGAYGTLAAFATLLTTRRLDLSRGRGMHAFYDAIDWVGGYPYEFACFEEVETFMVAQGFSLREGTTRLPCGKGREVSLLAKIRGAHTGCNEFVFQKAPSDATE